MLLQGLYIFIAPVFPGLFFLKTILPINRLFTLGKEERLKSRKLIEQLFREGKSFAVSPFRVYYLYGESIFNIQPATFHVQFGVGVSAKNFKKAVDRNRVKRLMRESYRLQKKILYDVMKEKNKQLAVFVIYTGKALPGYEIVSEKIGVALLRLVKEIN
jgi:ribonuclease P protein component